MWKVILFKNEFYQLFYIFFLYGIIGWIYESCFVSIRKKSWVNRGFLNGPVLPIYGGGALIIYLVFWNYRAEWLLVFFGGALLATVLEYITSLVMEKIFHMRWWDYTHYRFHLNGRICLEASLLWGTMAILLLNVIQPGINYIILKIPRELGEIAGYVIIPVFLTDIIVTIVYTVKFDQLLAKAQKLRQDMQEYLVSMRLFETKEGWKKKLSGLRLTGMFTEVKEILDVRVHHSRVYQARKPELEARMGEFLHRYQELKAKKMHIRLIKAFPSLKVGNREAALKDIKEKIMGKGVRTLNKEIKDLKVEVTGRIQSYVSGFLRAAIVGLLVLAQFAMILYLSFKLRGFTVYIYSFIQVLSIIIIIGLVNDNRNTSYKISWICIIAAFPITGHIMFMLWGNRRGRRIEKRVISKLQNGLSHYEYNPETIQCFMEKYPTKSRMTRYLETNGFPLYKNNQVSYYPMGEDTFDAIFEEIDKAQKFVLINFFIVGEGALWDRLHELLLKKIKQGVKVMFLYDDFGAILRTPKNFKRDLENEGMEVRVFNPIHKYTDKLYMNYRSHQKIIVIDGNVGFTGGMNLADEYVNIIQRFGVWKDNAIKVEGDAVWGLTVTFLQMWEVSSDGEIVDYDRYRPTRPFEENDVFCQVISDGPANNPKNPIESIYKQMIYYAKKRLYITTPYLIIEDDMREALITAARSGIDVRIITPYIPDKKNVKLLTEYNYGRLLAGGVRIFEYTPGFIHAKTIITEDAGIIGTINMDYRSFHLHYECGVWVCNRDFVDIICQDLVKTMEQCREVTYEEWKNRPLWMKIYQMVLNLFSTLM
ncbi:MAG: cardiolipin synthase [Lachnospiraceae bacterium]|jgi:cardiolipin synthase|nr:cardiolipin synthase [Lachnospiraceae bacterium]